MPLDPTGPHQTGPDRTGPDRTGPDRIGLGGTGPDRTGPDRTGSDRIGPDRIGADQTGPDCTHKKPMNADLTEKCEAQVTWNEQAEFVVKRSGTDTVQSSSMARTRRCASTRATRAAVFAERRGIPNGVSNEMP